MNTKAALFLIALLFSASVQAAWISNHPVTVKQPDGTSLQCFATGDEYYNWIHDAENYTIIQNHKTGYWCYAKLVDGQLQASDLIAGHTNPALFGLTPGINISASQMLQLRNARLAATPKPPADLKNGSNSKSSGTINNLVIYIRFSGEPEFTDDTMTYYNFFVGPAGSNSMKNYFEEASYGALHINTKFYPHPSGSTVISYQDTYPRSHYEPYDAITNPGGYTDQGLTEHELLINAINAVSGQIPAGLNLDYNNDGYIDNICFIVDGNTTAWSTLLWPHRWTLYSQNIYINGKRVYDYNLQVQNHLLVSGNGVLCHEMFHTLGAPDLYHYNQDGLMPVGIWDLMQSNQEPPQHMGAYMKFRYGGWISSIPVISAAGTYTLNPLTTPTGNCYRINSPNSTTEYFVVEYRKKSGVFESSLPGSGIVVYRINSNFDGYGNAGYDGGATLDEVYVYRPGGDIILTGQPDNAYMSANVNRKKINNNTDPSSFLSDGSPGGLDISAISTAGGTISFNLNGGAVCASNLSTEAIPTPVSGCNLTANQQVRVTIKNTSNLPLAPGTGISYQIDNNAVVTESIPTVINVGGSYVYTFAQTADFSTFGTHTLKAFTSLALDCDRWNDTIVTTVTHGKFDYDAIDAQNFSDSYIDLGSNGNVITTADFDDASSAAIDIGFNFGYDCSIYSKFVLNTNGFIRLGTAPPSTPALYFDDALNATGGIFNSNDTADINIISAFNHDLEAGTGTPEYRVYTSGTAPNRICTIQFKNLRDKTTNPAQQYDNINFQIKLHESSNVIDFVYGTWTPSAAASYYKTSACGLKGPGHEPGQLLVARKSSMSTWDNVIFENVNYSATATLNFGNPPDRPAPDPGQTFRFTPNSIVTGIAPDILAEVPSIGVFPNPTKGIAQIAFNGMEGERVNVRIYNCYGMLVSDEVYANAPAKATIDLSRHSAGIYFIVAESANKTACNKLVIE
ncbi:MAG: M6 family metalloprotease domain-containing protein [Bacteroidota bacterium]